MIHGESVPPADEPEDIVKGMVLHHHHDDVVDLRELIDSDRSVGEGERTRLTERGRCRPGRRGRARAAATAGERGRCSDQGSAQQLTTTQGHGPTVAVSGNRGSEEAVVPAGGSVPLGTRAVIEAPVPSLNRAI